ncbi:MAG: hypothetical protein ACI4SM_00705 [Candidatus Gastranaerophilaceae bacterium]
MSVSYPDLTETNFPQAIDTFNRATDVTLELLPYVQEYQKLYNTGKLADAAQILVEHPELQNCIINASTINKCYDAIKALQRFYMSDIQKYIEQLITYKGEYSSKISYEKYDVILYNGSAYLCISDSPIGTLPTDLNYFTPLTLKGEQGESGTGLSSRGVWDKTVQYYKDDLVSYNNQLWAAKEDNFGSLPNDYSTVWYSVLSLDVTKDYVDTKYNELFQSVSNGKTTVANAITDKGVATNTTDTFAIMANNISQIETGIHTTDATATANQILENCTAYVNDNKIIGTMTDFSKASNGDDIVSSKFNDQPIVNAIGKSAVQYGTWGANGDKEGMIVAPKQGYYPNTSDATTSYMYIPADRVAAKLKINPYKIVKGYTIAGIQGTADTSGGITNFHLTISTSQPSPIDVGHIWVNTSRVSNPRCYIVPYIYDSIPNNSVIFVVGTYANMYYWGLNNANGYETEIYNQGSTRGWRAGYKSGSFETWLPTPMVYTKVDNIIYIETTYMWNGSTWICVSNADKYLMGMSYGGNLIIGNITNNLITEKNTGIKMVSNNFTVSKNGEMMASHSNSYGYGFSIAKRIGDTFSMLQEVSKETIASIVNKSNEDEVAVRKILFSSDARYMLVFVNTDYPQGYGDYIVTSMHMIRYKLNNNKTQYDLLGDIVINNNNEQHGIFNADASNDLSTIVVSDFFGAGCRTTVYIGDIEAGYVRNDNMYDHGKQANVAVSPNGVYAFVADTEHSTQLAIYIDKNTYKAYFGEVKNYSSYIEGQAMKIRNDGEVLLCTQSSSNGNNFTMGHFKINWDGVNVTCTDYVINKDIASFSNTLSTFKYISDIIFNDDKNQCYAVVLTSNSYGSAQRVILAKIEFSNGIFNTLTPLSTTDLSMTLFINNAFLIGY